MTLTHILLVANLLALGAILAVQVRLHLRAQALAAEARALAGQAGALPGELLADAGVPAPAASFYTIEILNPLEVAATESRLGGVFGSLTPAIVRREVYRRARGIIREQLATRGIVADVKLHGAG